MRCVVGGYEVDLVVEQGLQQAFFIFFGFDGWVLFDENIEVFVVFIGKLEVVYGDFCGDFFFFQWDVVVEQVGFCFGGQVQDVQVGIVFFCQADGVFGGFVVGLCVVDDGVEFYWYVIIVYFVVFFFVLFYDLFFF